jgi:hypothetical protein
MGIPATSSEGAVTPSKELAWSHEYWGQLEVSCEIEFKVAMFRIEQK